MREETSRYTFLVYPVVLNVTDWFGIKEKKDEETREYKEDLRVSLHKFASSSGSLTKRGIYHF